MSADVTQVLTINAGSSSIRFALFAGDEPPRRTMDGRIERIGLTGATLRVDEVDGVGSFTRPLGAADHPAAITALLEWIDERSGKQPLHAIGHRVVHGGSAYGAPALIDDRLIDELRRFSACDPTHLPQEIRLIEAFRARLPRLPQIACFDTAFHHDLPRVARLLPIPRRYEAEGLRRYGFHGLSYAFLIDELERAAGTEAAHGRVILAHLGNGASLAAVRGGRSIDTSMGFTPTGGVPMSTRSGDLDPGVLRYLASRDGLDPQRLDELLTAHSGLLGVSETSSDMRDLLALEAHDLRAAEAIDLFCYSVRKWIGAFAAALGGLDTLVFAGGIGEQAPQIRERICAGLGFLGVELDLARNARNGPLISSGSARVSVWAMKTDEEVMIARSVIRLLSCSPTPDSTSPRSKP